MMYPVLEKETETMTLMLRLTSLADAAEQEAGMMISMSKTFSQHVDRRRSSSD